MAYKHAYLNTLLLLNSTFMLSVVKMLLKEEVGGHALNIIDHGKSWKNHGIVFLNFCGNLVLIRKHIGIGIVEIIVPFRLQALTKSGKD